MNKKKLLNASEDGIDNNRRKKGKQVFLYTFFLSFAVHNLKFSKLCFKNLLLLLKNMILQIIRILLHIKMLKLPARLCYCMDNGHGPESVAELTVSYILPAVQDFKKYLKCFFSKLVLLQ